MKAIYFLLALIPAFTTSAFGQSKRKATLDHVAIYVIDVTRSADFYQNVIGLDTIPEPFHDGKHCWLSISDNAAMHIIQGAPSKRDYYKNTHTCFRVASVAAFTDLLRKRKISWEDRDGARESITSRVDGVKQIWLQDPDGYWIEINDAKE